MKVKKITITFQYDNGDNLKQVVTDKSSLFAELDGATLLEKTIDLVDNFKEKVQIELGQQQLPLE